MRAKFRLRGFELPEHVRWDPVFPEFANTLFKSHKHALWVFSVMMSHYERGTLFRQRGDQKAWQGKVREYHQAWLDGVAEFQPDARYAGLLIFLFPEAETALRQDPADYVRRKRMAKQ